MLRHPDVTWSNPKVLATFAVIFLCGAVIGSAVTRSYVRTHWAAQTEVAPDIEKARQVGLRALKARLKLTSSQEQVVNKILDDYGKFYQNIEDEREDVAAEGKRHILEVLSPEQQQRFNEMIGVPPR